MISLGILLEISIFIITILILIDMTTQTSSNGFIIKTHLIRQERLLSYMLLILKEIGGGENSIIIIPTPIGGIESMLPVSLN